MQDIIMDVAKELGIADHVSIKERANSIEPLVTITYSPIAAQSPIHVEELSDRDRLKKTLAELAELARRG